jgi:DNA-binding MarR family transcriptional regulator
MEEKERDMESQVNCVCFNLRSATRAVTQFYDAEMRRHGIRPTQCSILVAGIMKESWSMADLSDVLGMDRTTLIRNLRPLQRDGFVLTEAAAKGGRVEVSITALGRKKVQEARPAWLAAQQAMVETLGKDRWSAIFSDLEKAAMAISK